MFLTRLEALEESGASSISARFCAGDIKGLFEE